MVGDSNTENQKLAHRHASCSTAGQVTHSVQTSLVISESEVMAKNPSSTVEPLDKILVFRT